MSFVSGIFSSLFGTKPPPLRSILFVCTANLTRSPIAAAMFAELARKKGDVWRVASAGARTEGGHSPLPVIRNRMKVSKKLSIDDHLSQPVTRKLLKGYRWVMVMETKHRDRLVSLYPDQSDKIHVLRAFGRDAVPEIVDMPDPTFSTALDVYDELFAIMDVEIPRIYSLLSDTVTDLEMGEQSD